jgi:protein SCO1
VSSETRRPSRLLLIVVLVISLSITGGSLFFVFYQLSNQITATTNTGAAIVSSDSVSDGATMIDPPRQLADFTLTGVDGQPLSFSDLYGKVTLLYFGYTHCPDVCPITLGEFRQVKAHLGDAAENVNFLMISVDGARDTPEYLGRYLAGFDEEFYGMTGSEVDLRRIGVDYGLYFQANEGEYYTVDHTAAVFMVDQTGQLHAIFAYGTEPKVMVEKVQALLS